MNTARQALSGKLSRVEFTLMMSMLMAVTALAIDLMLPAFGVMREHFGLAADSNALAPVVTFFLMGLAVGQLVLGPMSDAFGRKPLLYFGLALYIAAAIGAAFAPSLGMLFALRFIGGIGGAGVRVAAVPLVRDAFEGEQMARVMSYIMAVFIMVPVIAPTLGAALLQIGSWQLLFWAIAVFGLLVGLWCLRLPETLHPADRIPLNPEKLKQSAATVVRNRFTMGLTLSQTLLFGFFASYLASSQLIIDDVFGLDPWFPLIFAATAVVLGIGMLVNTRLLKHFTLRPIMAGVMATYLVASTVFALTAIVTSGTPPFWLYMATLLPIIGCHALLIPNINAASMIPMGAVAGMATAVIGTISMLFGAGIGAFVDTLYDGTILPLAIATAVLTYLSYAFYRWADAIWDRVDEAELERV
ncbi:MAG: multidrug effflux MFS transporter [Acidimicrobiia bacterium]